LNRLGLGRRLLADGAGASRGSWVVDRRLGLWLLWPWFLRLLRRLGWLGPLGPSADAASVERSTLSLNGVKLAQANARRVLEQLLGELH